MDDIVTKIMGDGDHYKDLQEIFAQIRKFNMRLNPKQFAFGIRRGKFLRFLLTIQGMEANLEKCRAILEMRSLSTLKELQQLIGCIIALSRFLARLAKRAHPFFLSFEEASRLQMDGGI